MTILVTADLHLNNLPRDNYRHDFQKQLRALVTKHKVTTVLLLGDITDAKDFHPAALVNKVVGHIHELAQLATVVVEKGNHDYSSIAEVPFFNFINRLDRVYWIGEPTLGRDVIKLPAPTAADLSNTLFLPHSPNPARDWANVPLKGHDWVFAHNTFDGALGDNGRVMAGTPTSIFPKGSRVISGDVHVPQTVGPVTYVGAPFTVDFGDSFDPRILLIKDNKLISIPCDGPQKQLIEIQAGEKLPSKTSKIMDTLAAGDILKVRVELDIGQYAQWAKIKDEIYTWGQKHGFVIHQVQPVTKQKSMSKRTTTVVSNAKSDVELLKGYAKSKAVDERTVKVGLDLLRNA